MLRRPHVLLEPGVQRQVVGESAEEGHRNVSMGIDETGYHQAPCGLDNSRSTVGGGNLCAGAKGDDRVAAKRQRSVGQNGAALVHGDNNAAEHENVGHGAIGTGVVWVTH